jgi:hypothetical protein
MTDIHSRLNPSLSAITWSDFNPSQGTVSVTKKVNRDLAVEFAPKRLRGANASVDERRDCRSQEAAEEARLRLSNLPKRWRAKRTFPARPAAAGFQSTIELRALHGEETQEASLMQGQSRLRKLGSA